MYSWLDLIERESKTIGANAESVNTIDGLNFLMRALAWVEARVDDHTHQTFAPLLATRYYDATPDNVDFYLNRLNLDYPLTSASSVSINDHALTLWDGVPANKAAADYTYYPRGASPAYALQGLQSQSVWTPANYGGYTFAWASLVSAIAVTGVWGYGGQWRASGDTVESNPLTNAATTFTVNDADGAGYDGTTPRFSPGMVLQVESEWMDLTAVDITTNTLTVVRGARGSTAAQHAQNTPISVWYPDANIQRAVTRQVAYLYHRRGVYQSYQVDTVGGFISQFPQDLSEETRGALHDYVLEMFRARAV
jgi:hypothetical protein